MTDMTKSFKNNIRILRKYNRIAIKEKNKNDAQMWLTDNFHTIEKNYEKAYNFFKKEKALLISKATTTLIAEICKDGILPETDKITTVMLKKSISTPELQALELIIISTLLSYASENIKENDEILINSIKSLIALADIDFEEILYDVSETEKLLCQDPSGMYRNMSNHTKYRYRTAIFNMSKKYGKSESETAVEILEKAESEGKHIGFFLEFPDIAKKTGFIILLIEWIFPLITGIILSIIAKNYFILPLIYFPIHEVLKCITTPLFSHISESQPLPRMDYSKAVPESEKTVIAISLLLSSSIQQKEISEHLKNLCLSNCRDSTSVCILADLKSSDTPVIASDSTDIKSIKKVVDELNKNYGDKFTLAVRKRVFSTTENEYTGYERKRGAIGDLVKYICDGTDNFILLHGNKENLRKAKYIMALDSDTKMPADSIKELVAIASHPLNRPVISTAEQKVISGYGIISPRTETDIKSASKTHFSSVMAGCGGLPAYTGHVREKYMDLFSQSIFSGKGLIDVNAFKTLLVDRLPEQQILSHDILEGIILRTAFAGETALTDSFPSNQTAYFRRLHRWIRGDVQNLFFCIQKKN